MTGRNPTDREGVNPMVRRETLAIARVSACVVKLFRDH